MRKWLAKLAFAFFVVGLAFAWEGRRSLRIQLNPRKANIQFAAAFACITLGFAGLRERHRRPPTDDPGA